MLAGPLSVDATYAFLKRRMIVSQGRDAPLIEITISSPDPVKAAIIANEIAGVFLQDRLTDLRERELKQFKKKPSEALIVRDRIEAPEMIRRAGHIAVRVVFMRRVRTSTRSRWPQCWEH